ncbi:MAG TPA: hypothetical protein VJN18_18990 [Polyangiaceae bacterium]|nr:hypothetical protein [Polyangiaceae bacterium]
MSRSAQAAPSSVLVEIDSAAERLVDARSTRRLLSLELADVAVPAGRARGAPVLFFRVLGRPSSTLRIELWELGEYHGQRTLGSAGESPQLVARRVALAAAELGRRLARKRVASLAREERQRASRLVREQEQRERTQEGPLALRSELLTADVPGKLLVLGTRLTGEITLQGSLRLDVGAEFSEGWLDGARASDLAVSLGGISLGPSYRFVLTRGLDLDVGARGSAMLLQAPATRSLDAILDQTSAWTARLDGSARLQLRLSRQVRASLGGELGGLLRGIRYVSPELDPQWLRGMWWGGALGLVITPAL